MSLLFFDGFEGDAAVVKPEWIVGPNVSRTTAIVRSGLCTLNFGGTTANTLRLPASAKLTVGFAIITSGTQLTLSFRSDLGATTHLNLTFKGGAAPTLSRGATVLATAVDPLPSGVWRHVQVQETIADAGGRCIVKIDGVTIIDYTGDTRNGGTSTDVDTIVFQGAATGAAGLDDLWVCDGVDATATQKRPNNDFLGDLKVQPQTVDGNGAVNQWTPSAAGTNAQQVDEPVPPNTTDYVYTATTGNRDLFSLTDLPASTAQVYAVRVAVYAQKSDAGSVGIKTLVRDSSGSVDAGATQPLSTTWTGYHGPIRTVNPATGAAWTPAEVNALQAGVEATS